MRPGLKLLVTFLLLFTASTGFAAEEAVPFTAKVNSDNINIRADSTVSADIICKAVKGESVEVVSQNYSWYKIRLPKHAPSFVKKDLVAALEDKPADSFDKLKSTGNELIKNAKVIKERVNIRLAPGESSAILGKISRNEVVVVVGEKGGWYQIEPVKNSFGWINAKFLTRSAAETKPETPQVQPQTTQVKDNNTAVEGIIRPYGMVFKRAATHKLITGDDKIFLLKGNKKNLDQLNYHKVRVSGKITATDNQKYPVIETERIEALD